MGIKHQKIHQGLIKLNYACSKQLANILNYISANSKTTVILHFILRN